MKKILTLFSLGIFVPFAIMAQQWGFWDNDRSYIWFQENANVNTYSIWNGAPGTFHNHNFGTLSYGDVLTINGYDTKTWKNEGAGGDVTGCEYFYTIYPTGNRPPSPVFISMGGGWIENLPNPGDQKWGNHSVNANILSGLPSGDYTIEIYGKITGKDCGSCPSYDQFDSNGGNNYLAYFTYNNTATTVADGNWSSNTIWQTGVVPEAQTHVTINHQVIINNNTSCNNLTLNSGSLTLDAPLTINGQLTTGNQNNKLFINAGGSLIATSTVSGYGTLVRNISGNGQYHYLATPVSGVTAGNVFPVSQHNNIWLRQYDEPSGQWQNLTASSALQPLKGYAFYMDIASTTATFSGELGDGSYNFSLSHSGSNGANYDYFNFVGNPYPSALDWKAGTGWTRNDLELNGGGYDLWIWNGALGQYGAYNSAASGDNGTNGISRYIPWGQAFFVKAANAGTLQVNNSARAHSSQAFLKNGIPETPSLRIKVSAPNGLMDEVYIEFGHEEEGFTAKWFSMLEEAPGFYVYQPATQQKSTLAFLKDYGQPIPLGLKAGVSGKYRLELNYGLQYKNSDDLYLKDLATGQVMPLQMANGYEFEVAKGEYPQRLMIYKRTTGIENGQKAEIKVYGTRGGIMLHLPESGTVTVYDLTGRKLVSLDNVNAGPKLIEINKGGIYLVKITTGGQTQSNKVFVDQN
ncbi:MAG: hypothetical protein PWP35_48 [Bacteroidales bacterium]|jgi:hypothetical protein|nr:hypothetical protein [Bacteroidales bacterium]